MKTAHLEFLKNRFNAAAWKETATGRTHLMLREVSESALPGEPDRGKLVRLVLNSRKKLLTEEIVWQPQNDEHHLEDPRVYVVSSDLLMLGLTYVQKNADKSYVPYPAIATVQIINGQTQIKRMSVINQFGLGKNITPFDGSAWVLRKECDFHKLTVISWDGENAEFRGEIDFSAFKHSWMSYRMGTTMSPIWITPREGLMIIHGIDFRDGIYHYSLGRAKIVKDQGYRVVAVDEVPMVKPEHFYKDGVSLYGELHPFRRVVYACGGVVKRYGKHDVLTLYVNVGDRHTVEVRISMRKLLQDFWTN